MISVMDRDVTPASIREWRLSQGMTQEELAERLGVDQTTVAKWETKGPGRGWVQFWQVALAAAALGMLDELTGGRLLGRRK